MQVIIVLIAISLFLAISFLVLFFIAAKRGQFSDTYTPSVRILFDDKDLNKNKDSK